MLNAPTILMMSAVVAAVPTPPLWASDYLDSPVPKATRQLDLNDLYVWRDQSDQSKINIVLTIGSQAEIPANAATMFSTKGKYTIHFDSNADFDPERTLSIYFGGVNEYAFVLEEAEIKGVVGFSNERDGIKVYAGLRQNPAATDQKAIDEFLSGRALCVPPADGGLACLDGASTEPTNSFAGHVVAAIAAQIPLSKLAPSDDATLNVWAQSWEVP